MVSKRLSKKNRNPRVADNSLVGNRRYKCWKN